jgi:hypothetical protein
MTEQEEEGSRRRGRYIVSSSAHLGEDRKGTSEWRRDLEGSRPGMGACYMRH